MKPFFFLCLKEKVRLSLRMDQSPPYPSLKTRAGFFLKRFNHHFSCLCGTSGFLAFVRGKWTQLSPQFTVWLWVDFWSFSCTSVTSRLYSGFVFVLILMRFILQLMALFLNHDFDILMHYFVLSLKKNKHLILPHFHLDYFEAFSPLTAIKVHLVSKSQRRVSEWRHRRKNIFCLNSTILWPLCWHGLRSDPLNINM